MEWHILTEDKRLQSIFSQELKISHLLSRLIINRGVREISTAKSFLQPDLNNLRNPYDFKGMESAVDRILRAIKRKERILIFGDYDVDGITSTALLFSALKEHIPDLYYYIPNRFTEGYGLNRKMIELAHQNQFHLIITVDCGVSSIEEIEEAKKLGIEVIIIDHHKVPPGLPSYINIINPEYLYDYPFKDLAGVGVCFKVVQALYQKLNKSQEELFSLLDYVALGTIADCVPFLDENRIFVKNGLEVLNKINREGLKALILKSGLEGKKLTIKEINFALVPRLNAAGRISDPKIALELLLTDSSLKATYLAKKLDEINKFRRDISESILKEARQLTWQQIEEENNKILVISSEEWNQGIVGIIASRLIEEFNRPAIVIARKDGVGKGSGRSIKGFNLFKALESCRNLLVNFGGHKYAVGVTIDSDQIERFKKRINECSADYFPEEKVIRHLEIDAPLSLPEINSNLIKEINCLEPFGLGNPPPVFCSFKNNIADWRSVGENKEHLKLKILYGNKIIEGIGFGLYKEASSLFVDHKIVDLAFNVELNQWNGTEIIQLNIKDIKYDEEANREYGFESKD